MKKTLFLIIALAGTLSLRAEENDLFEDEKFDFSALEQEIISQEAPKASSKEDRNEEEELEALFLEDEEEATA